MKQPDQKNDRFLPTDSRRGSALMLVLLIATCLLIVLTVSLRWGLTEKRLNTRHTMRQHAKNASESLVEYGFAELVSRFTGQTSFPSDELEQYPLAEAPTHSSFYGNTNISLGSGDAEVIGGQITPSQQVFIDPNDPANEFDPFRGKVVVVREVAVYGKATALPDGYGSPVTSYTMQRLQVRDSPLFSHAIFYNMDLEMHSGSTMYVRGPIHVNGDAWMEAKSSGPLYIEEGIMTTGEVLHGRKQYMAHKRSGPVYIKDSGGTDRDMRNSNGAAWNTDPAWLDSRDPDWRELASQRWDGAAQDEEHQVPTLNPLGFNDYVQDDPTTGPIETENHGYAVIEPVLTTLHQDYKGDSVRKQKYAYKAGLVFEVTSTDPAGGTPGDLPGVVNFAVAAKRINRMNPLDPASPPAFDANGDLTYTTLALPPGVIGEVNAQLNAIRTDGQSDDYKKNTGSTITVDGKSFSSGDVYGGMYDHRPDIELDLITIDVEALKDAIEDNDEDDWSTSGNANDRPERWWNGVVYVQFPTQVDPMNTTLSTNRVDKIVPGSRPDAAVMLINTDEIPDPYLTNNSFHPERGFSIATNNPIYTVGDVNADGNSGTGTAQTLDDPNEPPMAIAADTFTVLTENYGVKGRQNSRDNSVSSSNRPGAYTELSAAILTGLIPTVPQPLGGSGATSGGVHNFPRMIEYWSGTTMRIRGSLVALFESEVHPFPRPTDYTHYYRWPTRDFGFNDNFRNGMYPPGSPNAQNFRRVAFQDITREEYDTAVANLFP